MWRISRCTPASVRGTGSVLNTSFCHSGIDLDVIRAQKESLPAGFADRMQLCGRATSGLAIAETMGRDTQANPVKTPPFTFPAHVHEAVNNGFSVKSTDVVAGSGWGDWLLLRFGR